MLDGGRRAGRQHLHELIERDALVQDAAEGEIEAGAVGIDVGEAAGDGAFAACDALDRVPGDLRDLPVEVGDTLPGHRRLEGRGEDAARHRVLAVVWGPDELVAPGAGCARAMGVLVVGAGLGHAAVAGADLQRPLHPGIERMVGRFEGEHEHRFLIAPRDVGQRLARLEQPAVGGIEPRLGDLAHRVGAVEEALEAHGSRSAERRLLAQAHPGFGDDAQNALGADEQAVGAGAGAGTGQAAALQRAGRRHHAGAFDEVVDMRVERGVVAARARGDPAAQGRAAIGLHVVAHGEGAVAQLVLDRGPIDAALDARGVAHRIDFQHLVHVARRDRHHLVELGAGLDALHHRRAAAVGDRLGADPVAPVEQAHDVLLVLGEGHGVGRVGHLPHEHARGVEARLAVAVLQPRQVIGAHDVLQRIGHGHARRA